MIAAKWPAPKNIKAYVTTRIGGISKAPFSSNNLGSHVGDDLAAVESNRKQLNLHLPNDAVWLNQTHSTTVQRLPHKQSLGSVDACYTTELNQVCCVMTADCLPILIANKSGTQVAAIHAGWKGLHDGVIENTLATFRDSPKELIVWLGPAIGPNKFEVGQDVFDLFIANDNGHRNCFIKRKDKYLANIYQLARNVFKKYNIVSVYGGDYCTVEQNELFFSYRRDGQTGRMASLIWIDS